MTRKQMDEYLKETYEQNEYMKISEKKRAAVYVRYSSENQRDGYSVEYQLDECKKYIESEGMLFVNSYIDEATTGKTTDNRAAFFQMLADVKRGLYDCVIVYKYSRFARNLVEASIYRQQIEKAGAQLISAMERIDDTTPEGKMMRNIIMVMDEYYSDNLATFVSSSMHTAAKSGKILGGAALFGYRRNEEKKLEIEPREAELVKRIFELYANGMPLGRIVEHLNADGIRTRRGNPFSESGLYAILRNEKYIGRFTYSVEGYETIVIDNAIPAIIDAETWQRVHQRIADYALNTTTPRPRKKERIYPLTGKITCGCCGNVFFGSAKARAKTDVEYNYYVCRGKKHLKICTNKDIRKEHLEAFVFGEIKKHLLNPEVIEKLTEETYAIIADGAEDLGADLKKLKAEKAKIEKKLEALLDAMLDGDMPKSMMKKKSAKLNESLAEIEKQLDRKQVAAASAVSKDMIRGFLTQLMQDLDSGNPELQQAVAEQMVRNVIVSEDEVTAEIGVNFNYFFRDEDQNGGAILRISLKRKDLKQKK